MYIKRITQIEDVLRLVPIEVKLREKEKSPVKAQELLTFVQSQLNNPLFYIVCVYEDETEKDIVGYMILFAIPFNLMDMKSVNILRVYYDPKYRHTDIRNIGWQIIEEIAKMNKIKKVRIEVKRGMKAYEKTWKFKQVTTVMERRV
jgi:hypothetical protein